MACNVWLRRDFLLRHDRTPPEPPCNHDPQLCPPERIGRPDESEQQ